MVGTVSPPRGPHVQQGRGEGTSCRTSQDGVPLHRRMLGSDLVLAFASNRTKVFTSCDHRPPTSPARTTRRALARGPTSSGWVLSLLRRAATRTAPSEIGAALRAIPANGPLCERNRGDPHDSSTGINLRSLKFRSSRDYVTNLDCMEGCMLVEKKRLLALPFPLVRSHHCHFPTDRWKDCCRTFARTAKPATPPGIAAKLSSIALRDIRSNADTPSNDMTVAVGSASVSA